MSGVSRSSIVYFHPPPSFAISSSNASLTPWFQSLPQISLPPPSSSPARSYEKVDRTAHEIKADVERHLEEKELIELGIPSSIVIGPFHVLTENVRQALSKKRKALANALLELLARILRGKVDSVSAPLLACLSVWQSVLCLFCGMLHLQNCISPNRVMKMGSTKGKPLWGLWVFLKVE